MNRLSFHWVLALLMIVQAVASGTPNRQQQTVIVAIGDSTTAGSPYFLSPLEHPPEGIGDPEGQYSYWMMRKRPQWKVINYGIAGQWSNQIRTRFPDVFKRHPRYVIILAGVNDIVNNVPIDDIARNLLMIYQEAQLQNVMPVAATVLPFDRATPDQAKQIDLLNDWIKKAAERMHMPLADVNAALRDPANPHRLNGSPDGLHPDIGGYRKMAFIFIAAIEPIEKAWR